MESWFVGSWVRVAGREVLEASLRDPDPGRRPEPPQFLHAGRVARVVSVRRGSGGEPLYRLEGLPGEWRGAWLEGLSDPS